MKRIVAVFIGVCLGLVIAFFITVSLVKNLDEENTEEQKEQTTEAEIADVEIETNEASDLADSMFEDTSDHPVSNGAIVEEPEKEFLPEDPDDYSDLSRLERPQELEIKNNKDLASLVAKCYFRLLSGLQVPNISDYREYCNDYAYNQLLEYENNDVIPYETLEYLRNKAISNKLDNGELKEIDGVYCYPLDDGNSKFPSTKEQINAYKVNECNTSPFIKGKGKKAYLDKNAVDLMDIEIDDAGITHYLCTYKGIDIDVPENNFNVTCYSKDPVEVFDSQYDVPFYSNSTNEMWCKITVNIVDGKVESMVFKQYG